LTTATILGEDRPYVTNKYDEAGRVIEQDDADDSTPHTYFSYDVGEDGTFTVTAKDRNNIFDAINNINSHQVQYVSDGMGHILSVTDQNGNKHNCSYDQNGNLIYETNANGDTIAYTYDDDNNLIRIKDQQGYVTSMVYDNNGNILTVKGPNGEQNSYTYNVKNLLETASEQSGMRKTYTYNESGQIKTESVKQTL
jgi:YD repeat-containing protein